MTLFKIFNRNGDDVSADMCPLCDIWEVRGDGYTPGKTYTLEIDIKGFLHKPDVRFFREYIVADNRGVISLTDVAGLLMPYFDSEMMQRVEFSVGYDGRYVKVLYCDAEIPDYFPFLNDHFLTNYTTKRTAPGRKEVLRAMGYGEIESAQARAYFTDGSYEDVPLEIHRVDELTEWSSNEDDPEHDPDLPPDEWISFDCVDLEVSPAQFERPGLTLYRYVVVCGDRTMEYMLDPDHEEVDTAFLFRNCFGCYDMMYCNGKTEVEHSIERSSAMINGEYRNYRVKDTKLWNCDTGILTGIEKEWVPDFLCSRKIFMCKFVDGEWQPWKEVAITESEAKSTNEDDDLPRFTFTCRMAQRQQNVLDVHQFPEIFTSEYDKTYE